MYKRQLYNRLNPLLAWGDDYYGDKDILGEMGNVGNRQEFANICFAYLKQLCPEASVENYVEHYTSYNTVFGDGAFSLEVDGSIEAMEAIDPVSYTHLDVYKRQPENLCGS